MALRSARLAAPEYKVMLITFPSLSRLTAHSGSSGELEGIGVFGDSGDSATMDIALNGRQIQKPRPGAQSQMLLLASHPCCSRASASMVSAASRSLSMSAASSFFVVFLKQTKL
jgi:hypothetical protein